jgi:CxxC motif-containing protein (DUF1111 family)
MKFLNYIFSSVLFLIGGLFILMIPAGCGSNGNLTETVDIARIRDLSGISGPPDTTKLAPAARISRATFGTANTAAALAYPNLSSEEQAVFDQALAFFITDRTPENGMGPLFNQPICLGCHRNADQLDFTTAGTSTALSSAPLRTVSTPPSRAARAGVTDHSLITKTSAANHLNPIHPPTAAFTLFGDFFPATGAFNPLAVFGGPIQHVRAIGDCNIDVIPPEAIDPFIHGGIDPITGLSVLDGRRAIGERAAPPYIGRGLMEAIFAGDIVANDDPSDAQTHTSTLFPTTFTSSGCPSGGDCISGRHNENRSDIAFTGGDPVIRVSRFGLRAAGPTLFQFIIGGTQGEIGLTSPFSPAEQNNNQNVGRSCDKVPDPELTEGEVKNLRSLIRMISLPEFDSCLLEGSPVTANCISAGSGISAASIQNGATLFGVDLAAFRNRMTGTNLPDGLNDSAINVANRGLNCVGCHIPIMRTGQSPAAVGARHLTNKWFPIFSDLLLHDMGQIPQGRSNSVPPLPFSLQAGTLEIPRNLADFALPAQGLAFGREWRTPPLMGIGLIGPPFLHDARVFLSTFSSGGMRARTVQSSGDGVATTTITNAPLVVNSFDNALLAAIELHDLPVTDITATCPYPSGTNASTGNICPGATDGNRSEARNVMQRWHVLTPAQQQDVINFLKAL